MLNKELLFCVATPREGIYRLTIRDDSGMVGASKDGIQGDLPIKGTNNESFNGLPLYLNANFYNGTFDIKFPDYHLPNTRETHVYMHYKYDGSFKTYSFYFAPNSLTASTQYGSTNSPSDWDSFLGQTIEVYLGPSSAPPSYLE